MCSYRPFLYNCTILTIAVNALVHVAPVDLAGRCRTAKVALRLREAGYIEGCEPMHSFSFYNIWITTSLEEGTTIFLRIDRFAGRVVERV